MVIRAFGAAPIRDRAEILLGAMPLKGLSRMSVRLDDNGVSLQDGMSHRKPTPLALKSGCFRPVFALI